MASTSYIFDLYTTHGIPIELIIDRLRSLKATVDWDAFIKEAIEAGWSDRKLKEFANAWNREASVKI